MSREYSANVDDIRASSKYIDQAVRGSEAMGPGFERNWKETEGWWGEEGQGDDLADTLGDQIRMEQESVSKTIADITTGYLSLVDAVAREADPIQRPQVDAVEGIDNLQAESESRR